MNPEASRAQAMPAFPEPTRRAAFRRGRLLTVAVVAGTVVPYLWTNLPDLWSAHPAHKVSDVIFNCVLLGVLCRSVLLGGGFSTGCLGILYAVLLFPMVITATFLSLSTMFPGSPGPSMKSGSLEFHDLGHDFGDTVFFLVVGAWAAFSFWVLFLSRDADLYRSVRQRALAKVVLPSQASPFRRR